MVRPAHSPLPIGTLLWIGDHTSAEFREAFEYCQRTAAQIAIRADLAEALRRPASDVKCMVVAQSTREILPTDALTALDELYPRISRLNLLGSLCEGFCRRGDPFFSNQRYYWHCWNQVLPEKLQDCGAPDERDSQRGRSVAVIAAHFNAAEPLLELADSAQVTSVWSRQPDRFAIRNIDEVWWDDSVARPVSSSVWKQRISGICSKMRTPRHTWITATPRIDQQRQARLGGVGVIVSKPYRIDCLLEMLDVTTESVPTDSGLSRRHVA